MNKRTRPGRRASAPAMQSDSSLPPPLWNCSKRPQMLDCPIVGGELDRSTLRSQAAGRGCLLRASATVDPGNYAEAVFHRKPLHAAGRRGGDRCGALLCRAAAPANRFLT